MIIYALQCEEHKYYVGRTRGSARNRFLKHVRGDGAKWTRRYRPISYKVLERTDSRVDSKEHAWTVKYVQKYGFRNVRGGNYVSMQTDCYTERALYYFLYPIKSELQAGLYGVLDPQPGFATFQ